MSVVPALESASPAWGKLAHEFNGKPSCRVTPATALSNSLSSAHGNPPLEVGRNTFDPVQGGRFHPGGIAGDDPEVRSPHRGPCQNVSLAVAVEVRRAHRDADGEIQLVGKDLVHLTGPAGIEGAFGDVPAVVDVDVRVTGGGPRDDVGKTIAVDVADRHVDAHVKE